MNLKDFNGREETLSFTVSKYSPRFNYLSIGGLDGNIYIFNLNSKSKVGVNKTVHSDEILGIQFDDSRCQMITVSKDRQISIWDTAMFMCFTTLKKDTHEMGMIFN